MILMISISFKKLNHKGQDILKRFGLGAVKKTTAHVQ